TIVHRRVPRWAHHKHMSGAQPAHPTERLGLFSRPMAGARHMAIAMYAFAFAAVIYPDALFAHTVTGSGEGVAVADVLGTFLLVVLALVFAAGQWQLARRT